MPGASSKTKESKDTRTKDVIAISHKGDETRWFVTVTLGKTKHDLGEFPTVSVALTEIMRFYYEHRPAARRRKAGAGGGE